MRPTGRVTSGSGCDRTRAPAPAPAGASTWARQAIAAVAPGTLQGSTHRTSVFPTSCIDLPLEFVSHAYRRADEDRWLTTRPFPQPRVRASTGGRYFEYKTISPLLAAQVGMLASLLGHDYGVYRGSPEPGAHRPGASRFVSGEGNARGGTATVPGQARTAARRSASGSTTHRVRGAAQLRLRRGGRGLPQAQRAGISELQNNELMEAFRDRTVKIDVPYNTVWQEEVKIYARDFNDAADHGQAHRSPHDRDGGDVGRADAPGGAQEGADHAPPEDEALRRQDAARLHRGQHQGVPRGGAARGHGRHQPALHPGQDLERAGARRHRHLRQPVHGPERAGVGPPPPQPHHPRGGAASATASCSRW